MGPGFESLEVHQQKTDNPCGCPFFVRCPPWLAHARRAVRAPERSEEVSRSDALEAPAQAMRGLFLLIFFSQPLRLSVFCSMPSMTRARKACGPSGTKVKTPRGGVFIRGVTKIGSRRRGPCPDTRRPYFRKRSTLPRYGEERTTLVRRGGRVPRQRVNCQ